MRKERRSKEEIEADRWIWNHNAKVRRMGLTKREEEKLLVPSKARPFFGRSDPIDYEKPKAKKKRKRVDLVQFERKAKKPYWKKPKPQPKTKLDCFQDFMETKNHEIDYYMQLAIDLDNARNEILTKIKNHD